MGDDNVIDDLHLEQQYNDLYKLSEKEKKIFSSPDESPDINPVICFAESHLDVGSMDICIDPTYRSPSKFLIVDDESIAAGFVGKILESE